MTSTERQELLHEVRFPGESDEYRRAATSCCGRRSTCADRRRQ